MLKNTLLLLLFIFSSNIYAQKIEKSKEELKSGKEDTRPNLPTESENQDSKTKARDSDDDDDLALIASFLEILYYATLYGAIGDYENEEHLYSNLTPYPYFDNKSGNFIKYDDDDESDDRMRFDVENHFLYGSNADFGNHFKGKFRPFQYFYLQTDYRELIERDKIEKTTSSLSLFHFNLGYDRIRFEKFNLGWTLGATYIASGVNKAGFAYGLNSDFFAFKNVSFNSAMIWSKINGLKVNAFELRGKYHQKNHFFSMGFENLKIGSPSYNYVTLGAGIYF